MCGIVGYVGDKKASTILINGLQKLEYRGYDSAGISTIENKGISCMKTQGRVNKLYDIEGINELKGTIGIAHTRWATHGKPSNINAHPHMNNDRTISVVHNGIIENYNELKEKLIEEGYKFISETDTEVIPHLVDKYYKEEKNLLKAVFNTCKELQGSYAIEVIAKDNPDRIIVARKDSPMVIGISGNEKFVASDIPAVMEYTKDFYLIDDREIVELTKNSIRFFDKNLKEINKKIEKIEWDSNAGSKDGYEDYMLKEISEQPRAVRETIGSRVKKGKKCEFVELDFNKAFLKSINKIKMVACGTAMYAGLVAEKAFEEILRIETEVIAASEFRYGDPIIDEHTLVIFISQSGETADTIAALKLAKSKKSKTIAVTNVIGSSITREADYTIYTHAGPEIAVASTKAYTSQVVLLEILAIYFAEILEINNNETEILKDEILELPEKVENALDLNEQVKKIAKEIYKQKDIFFIGRGIDYAVTIEAGLKIKEVSYIHSDAYPAGELKHGAIALMEKGVNVVAIINDENVLEKTLSNVQEVITRGANVIVVTNQDMSKYSMKNIIQVPKTKRLLSPIVSIIPLQLLAYYVAKNKNLDVDKPRNLAKSVTVE
jgi:glucosamine--fructose-6-phosphate aminotransferase (isomerizing)